jgi:uncharacterized protein YacL
MEKITQIINYAKTPEFYYTLGVGLLVGTLLYFILRRKRGSSASKSSLDNLLRNFVYIIVTVVLTLQILIGIKKNTSEGKLKKNINDVKNRQKELEKKRQDIKKQIQDKNNTIDGIKKEIESIEQEKNQTKSKKQTKEKDIKEVSNKLKNLKK